MESPPERLQLITNSPFFLTFLLVLRSHSSGLQVSCKTAENLEKYMDLWGQEKSVLSFK